MKTYLFKMSCLLLALTLTVSSCKKDKDPVTDDTTTDNNNTTTTPEEDKAAMQSAGIELVNEMEVMSDNKGFGAMQNFVKLMGDDDISGGMFDSSDTQSVAKGEKTVVETVVQTSYYAQKYSIGSMSTAELVHILSGISKAQTQSESDFASITAEYTWNSTTKQFDSVPNSTQLIVNFPSDSLGTSNNAILTIGPYDAEMIDINGSTEDVPVGLNWNIKVDGSEVMGFDYSATVSGGRPTNVSIAFSIAPLTLAFTLTNDNNTASVSYSLSNATKVLVGIAFTINGDWTETSIQNNVFEDYDYDVNQWEEYVGYDPVTYQPIYETHYDTTYRDSVNIDKIIEDANFTYTLMNVKVVGTLNFAALYQAILDIDNGSYATEEAQANAYADAINANGSLYVAYTDDSKVIANLEAYAVLKHDTDWYQTPPVVEDFYEPDARFIYPDQSKVDIETYFDEGFQDLIDELNNFQDDLSAKYDINFDSSGETQQPMK